jgi:hypothetical protein
LVSNTGDNCGLPAGEYFNGQDSSFGLYDADLSFWGNQEVLIRFLMSSDASIRGEGWWIDDITITEVEIPGSCSTVGTCSENPLVDVVPDGPLTACAGSPVLAATTTGGVEPFSYQWTLDGVDIPGANEEFYIPSGLGTASYNCRVQASECSVPSLDTEPTVITNVDAPLFDGLLSATDAGSADCSIDLEWVPATTVCDGPLSYYVFRDVAPAVDLVPENLVASGLTGLGYVDSGGLVDGQTYFYRVQALDRSTGMFDGNAVELDAVPTGRGASACSTVIGPTPVPAGDNGTTPLLGDRLTPSGDQILVRWDTTSCSAPDYNLLYGDLAGVSSYTLAGSECGLGTSGSFDWAGAPAGNLFFLVVGTDGSTESSWGTDSLYGERNGAGPSGQCSVVAKDMSGTCP